MPVIKLASFQAVGVTPPSPFYVEECETCLELLFEVGLDRYLPFWFASNTQPQVETKPEYLTKQGRKIRDNCKNAYIHFELNNLFNVNLEYALKCKMLLANILT